MANNQHLVVLWQTVDTWNSWRGRNPNTRPDLSKADLRGVDLSGGKFSETYRPKADLRGANLSRADLSRADLSREKFSETYRRRANLSEANLSEANLSGADLRGADLRGANLSGADLRGADLREADLRGADLRGANLSEANLSRANLSEANLSRADLSGADLGGANLGGANLSETIFANINLADAKGLELCSHLGPSTIDIWTLQRSGPLPLNFLRGCGLPDKFIDYLPSLLSQQAIQFYSCFISYSSKDHDFAERLYADLQNKGVRCWFAPHDMRIGDKIRVRIDEVIRIHEKLLLVLSERSITSHWVEKEVETAFEQEQRRNSTMLFPVRLDDTIIHSDTG